MLKLSSIVIILVLFASLSACFSNSQEGIRIVENPEPIMPRDFPDTSEVMEDAKFLLKKLPLDDIERALGLAEMLYAFYIDGLRGASVVRHKRYGSSFFENDRIFRIVDKNRDVYYVGYSQWGYTVCIWKLDENGNQMMVCMPL